MSDLPRLLLCCFDVVPAPTAISRRMTEYLKGLSDRFQVVVLTVKTPDHTHIERYHGARLLRVPVGSGDLAARVQAFDRAVRRQLDSEEYVMVHAFDPFGGYALCERRSEFGYKIVYDASALPSVDLPHLHDEVEANRRFIARVRRQELFCLMNADAVIVANELTREFVTGLGVAREQVSVLPCPVDLTPYKPEVMGVPDATPMKLVHVGNLSNANDLPTVLEAMQLALQGGVDLGLTVVGPRHPAHQARLEERIAALKLAGKVDFQDPVAHDDLHKVLATADVGLVSLSDIERNLKVGSPLSRAAEYLAAGRPVIAADVPVARATLQEEGVLFYRAGDKQSLADVIISLASEPAQRVKLGKAARAQALEHDGAKIRADLVAKYVALTGTGIRAVGDAETTSPDEVTQLGQSLGAEDTKERKRRAAAAQKTNSGEQKVTTDPAVAAADTSPEAAAGDRPAVMGVPLREDEPPIVMGHEARELANELVQQVTTEPNALRQTEPPVVMGMPLPQQPLSMATVPAMMTPGDLAAELGQIDEPLAPAIPSSSPTMIEQPVATDPTAAPLAEEELPDTGAHLSLVPKEPPPPAPRGRGAEKPSTVGPVPAAPGRRKTRTSKSSLEPVSEAAQKPAAEKPAAESILTPAEKAAAEKLTAQILAAAKAKAEKSGSEKPKTEKASAEKASAEKSATEIATAEKSLFEKSIFAPSAESSASKPKPSAEKSVADKALFEKSIFASASDSSSKSKAQATTADGESSASARPASDTFHGAEATPSAQRSPAEKFAAERTEKLTSRPSDSISNLTPTTAPPSAPGVPEPLEVTSIPPPPRASVPPPPLTAASDRVFIPPLEMPGLTPAPKSSVSGVTPAFRSSPSGSNLTPVAPAVARPPEFVPLLTPPQPGPATSPSGLTRPPALPPRTTSGTFATVGAPPPLPFASSLSPPPLTKSPTGLKPSGLFPEAPAVPVISDSEIEEVDDGPEELADDELVEVGAQPATAPSPSQTGDEAPEMAPEDVGVQTVDTDASPPPSAIDPWLAMLVHGYCPPASGLFNRHTPPTTMPGRDT